MDDPMMVMAENYGVWTCPKCQNDLYGDVEICHICGYKKRQRGGKRQGSGRPSTLKNPIRVTITLEEAQKQFCLEQGELSQVIRTLIQEKMNLKIF